MMRVKLCEIKHFELRVSIMLKEREAQALTPSVFKIYLVFLPVLSSKLCCLVSSFSPGIN